jgi:hypothetical protein
MINWHDLSTQIAAAVVAAAIIGLVGWLWPKRYSVGPWLSERPWAVSALTAIATAMIVSVIVWSVLPSSGPVDVPPGAVMAFNLEAGCPSGWKMFKPATARIIIGAGADFQAEYVKDDRGDALLPKGYLDAKGGAKAPVD